MRRRSILQTGWAIKGCCAAVRGAILGSQGVSFVLQVRRLPNGEWDVPGQGSGPDLALLPPTRHHPPSPLAQRCHQHWILEPCGNGRKTKERKQASHLSAQSHAPGNCFLSCVLDKTVLTFAGCAKVPRPQALVAFCIHFSGFQTEGTWKQRWTRE